MGDLIFKGVKVEEIDLTNRLKPENNIDISQRASFNVKYSEDNMHCAANLTIDMMEAKDPNGFNFKISVTAFLDCEPGMDKKEIHVKAYDEVYPHARAIANTIFATAGLPPFVIPKVKMDPSKIVIKDNDEGGNDSTGFSS